MIYVYHFLKLSFLLVGGHMFCGHVWRSEFLNLNKSHLKPGPNRWAPWYYCLFGHALIHGTVVCVLTNSLICGVGEVLVHAGTDYIKAEGYINFKHDQMIHGSSKILWATIAMLAVVKGWNT